jgi:hypothetical membrane protein
LIAGEVHPALAGKRGAALWIVGVVGYLSLEAFTAADYRPAYSYATNYISDLGATGPRAPLMHAAFFLQGSTFLAGAIFIAGCPRLNAGIPRGGRAYLFLALSVVNAVGNILVGTVHSGMVHVAGAVLAIVGGNAAILAGYTLLDRNVGHLRRWYGDISKTVAALGFLCLFMLTIGWTSTTSALLPIGVWERGSVYSIFLWQLLTAAWLLRPVRTAE